MKTKFKFLITLLLLIVLSSTSLCLATNAEDIMLISNNSQSTEIEKKENIRSDLYVTSDYHEINKIIEGNACITADTLVIAPKNNDVLISGNLYAISNDINIKSNITYSETEKDELGNPNISVNNISTIQGNVFVMANKFTLDPGCTINGDLYVCANEIELGQNSIINGNIFATGDKINLNCQVNGDLYIKSEEFNMQYYGFIRRDLHLYSQNANINGYVYRNSFINSENITLNDKFINEGDFNIESANALIFCGKVNGNANINSKEITFDTNKSNCIIKGNLNYSSKQQLDLKDGIVLKEINYSEYKSLNQNNLLSSILDYILTLLTSLACTYVIYLLINKFTPNFTNKLHDIKLISLLKTLGIGLGFLILIPIIALLLFISNIGYILGFILLLIYAILLIIANPIFIITIATFAKNKMSNKLNIYLYILGTTIILSLINLIPYIGSILSILISLTGFGIMIKNLIPSKK